MKSKEIDKLQAKIQGMVNHIPGIKVYQCSYIGFGSSDIQMSPTMLMLKAEPVLLAGPSPKAVDFRTIPATNPTTGKAFMKTDVPAWKEASKAWRARATPLVQESFDSAIKKLKTWKVPVRVGKEDGWPIARLV